MFASSYITDLNCLSVLCPSSTAIDVLDPVHVDGNTLVDKQL